MLAPARPRRRGDYLFLSLRGADAVGRSDLAHGCCGGSAAWRASGAWRRAWQLGDAPRYRRAAARRVGRSRHGTDLRARLHEPERHLRGVWETGPYFHDGSAPTLDAVFAVGGGTVIPAESGTPSNGAQLVNQYVELNNDDTVRGRAYATLRSTPARLTFGGVDGGTGGTGAIEVRVSNARAIALTVTVNGIVYNAVLPNAGNDPTWRHTNWIAARVENVALTAGASNTVVVGTPDAFPDISIDEIVVTTASHLTRAAPHRRILALSAAERADLVAYLRQLDGTTEYNPDPGTGDLFADGFEYGAAAWSGAAP